MNSPTRNQALFFANDGPDLKDTNFWDSEWARAGKCLVNANAGAIRLLVPPACERDLPEMKTGREVVITAGAWSESPTRKGVEILFDDGSDNPYAMFLTDGQVQLAIENRPDPCLFTVWTREGKVAEFTAHTRRAPSLPCLKPWAKPKGHRPH